MGVKRISSESENVCSKKVKIELEEGIHVQAKRSFRKQTKAGPGQREQQGRAPPHRRRQVRWWLELHSDKIDMVDKYGKSATRSVDFCSILMNNKASVNKLAVGLGGRVSSPLDVALYGQVWLVSHQECRHLLHPHGQQGQRQQARGWSWRQGLLSPGRGFLKRYVS